MDVRPSARVPMRAYRQDAGNLVALTTIQLGNAILPLVVYPLLLATVGTELFSRIAVTEVGMIIALTAVIYSFDIDGVAWLVPKSVQADKGAVSIIFSEVLVVRLAILGAFLVLICALSPLWDRTTFLLLLSWMFVPLGYILQGAWFFQALERNGIHATVMVASRVAGLLLILGLIVSPAEFYLAPLIIGGTHAAGGAVLLGYAIVKYSIRLTPVSIPRVRELLIHGKEVFVGNMSVALYRDSNVLILNAFSSSAAVSTYSIAEKMVKVFQAGARPLNQLFFPKVIRALAPFSEPGRPALRAVLRYTVPQLALLAVGGTAIAIGFYLFRSFIPTELTSSNAAEIVRLVLLMAVSVLFGMANFMLGMGSLIYLGRRRYLAKSILVTGASSVVICVTLVHFFSATGAALTFVLAEMLLLAQILRAYASQEPPAS
jgi:O-antigen/teichoic acid export membrane protein